MSDREDMSERYWDAQLETMPVDRRRLLREHRLRWQLRRCFDGSPFYRALLEGAGLDPANIGGLADLQRVPMLDIGDLSAASPEDAAAWSVAPQAWWQEDDRVGPAVRRVLTDGDVVHRADLAARALWAAGGRPGHRLAVADTGRRTTHVAIGDGAGRIGITLQAVDREAPGPSGGGTVVTLLTPEPGNADPALAERRLAQVPWSASWPPPAGLAARTSGALALDLVAPTVAYACGEGDGAHWADDHFLIETVDPATRRPVLAGTSGALVITDLTREGSPLLRLWTGLEANLIDEPCPCGRTSARSTLVRPLG
jgi:phenylacetate-CoA ligase